MNNSALQRLSYKAGLTRVSSEAYDEMRLIAEKYLSEVINYSSIYMENAQKATIFPEDIAYAIERAGFANIYKVTGDVKMCKISTKKTIIARLREYQSQHDCFTMAKAPLERIFKDKNGFRWSKEALTTMHAALEFFIYKIFFFGLKIMLHGKRVTLMKEDLKLTLEMIRGTCKTIAF